MKKCKAITFSFDDGIQQDKRLIEILDRYALKATFNINSGLFDKYTSHEATLFGIKTRFNNHRIPKDEIRQVYQNHEVAAHSLTHPILPQLSDEDVIAQMREDTQNLEQLTGKKVNGFAYPGGYCEYYNERVKKLIQENTDLYYGRTAMSCYSFDLPQDIMMFHPTISHRELEIRDKLASDFLALKAQTPQIFYIWGHSYEMINEKVWEGFERFCERLAYKNDIYYGTNYEVFKYFNLMGGKQNET